MLRMGIIIFLAILGSSFERQVEPENDLCQTKNQVFGTDEEFVFKVYYNWNFVWVSAGEVTFRVQDQGEKYFITAKGRTYDSYDYVFKVRDSYAVWVDKNTLLPTTSIREVQEGGYQLYDRMHFKQGERKITSYRGRTKEAARKLEYDGLEGCMHDVLSVIYYARNVDYRQMKAGDTFPVRVFIDKEAYSLKVQIAGKETKHIKGLGKFKAVKVAPQVVEGTVFNDPNKVQVWATDDENRLPLQIETPLVVGTAKAILKSYRNLRHPLSAKVD